MSKLTRPLYSDTATGVFAKALAYRNTRDYAIVARCPVVSCRPSARQRAHRARVKAVAAAWHQLQQSKRNEYNTHHPQWATGYDLFMLMSLTNINQFFFYAIAGEKTFLQINKPLQITDQDYDIVFPTDTDYAPRVKDGAHTINDTILNNLYNMIQSLQQYRRTTTETIERP